MDSTLINAIVNATLNVLGTMASVSSWAGKPYLKVDDVARGDVTGVIGMTGEANGTISLTFDEASILNIVSNLFGEEISDLNRDVSDAVGELTNMISGQARRELEEAGRLFKGAVPSVITGKNHRISHFTRGPIIAIPFKTEAGQFTIEVCIEP